jgi:hypothetical protein
MADPYARDHIDNWVSDFCQSDALAPFPGEVRENAAALLEGFMHAGCRVRGVAPTALEREDVKRALLESVARLAMPDDVRPHVPALCRAFLEDLQLRGRIGNGTSLGRYVGALRQAYLEASAAAPPPFQRPGDKIGRNEPCPCGSGKKYKKCCGT